MNELTRADAKPPAFLKNKVSAGGVIAGIVPQSLDEAFRLAQALSESGEMVPQHFQNQPRKIMAAILRGAEIGLAPMQALSSIAVINGRATLWGDAIPALMQRAGHHIDVEIEEEGEGAVAVATLTRGDTGKVIERRFSVADAKRANLWAKKGPWQDYPMRMLMHRARSWAVRDGAADALMALQVSEEVHDYQGPDNARDVTPDRPRRRASGGYSLAPADPEPERDSIIEGETGNDAPAVLPAELASVHEQIMQRLEAGEDTDGTLDVFSAEIDAIRRASPGHGEMIDAAAEKARAA